MSRVLLVDDNHLNLDLYHTALRRLPEADCVAFTSSREALDWAIGGDVTWSSWTTTCPRPDGLEFIRLFRASDAADVPIVMIADPMIARCGARRLNWEQRIF